MAFYHRTLAHASSITDSVIGNFLDEEKEDIIVSTGRILKLLRFELSDRPDVHTLISVDIYDTIISLSKFRRQDEVRDWIVIATNSSNTAIFYVNAEKMEFELVVQHHCRVEGWRKHPVRHLAANSQQQAIFAAALEEMKMFWFFQDSSQLDSPEFQDSSELDSSEFQDSSKVNLHILDDYEENSLIYDIAFVDTVSKSIFVAYLATPYEELYPGKKNTKRKKPNLIFKEVNIEMNQVTKIRQMECFDYANSLISVPGQRGVLVCAEDFFAFYSMDSNTILRCPIPRRILDPKRGVIFVCSTKCSRNFFQNPNPMGEPSIFMSSAQNSIYYLAQTEQGDIFSIELVVNEQGINEMIIKYIITLPVASALCTFESGFLFVASEFGNHYIYNLADIEKRARVHPSFSTDLWKGKHFLFMHRHLGIDPVAEINSMSPIMQMEIEPLASMRHRMCLAAGRALNISTVEPEVTYQNRTKLNLKEDGVPLRMWAIESTESISMESENLIVVSFEYTTAVYSLQRTMEYMMERIENSQFAEKTNTLGCAKTGKDVIVQVCPEGVCQITKGKNICFNRADKKAIEQCAMNKKSLVLYFENKELMHHQINEDGTVAPSQIPRRLIQGVVTCMLLSNHNESDQLLAVGVSILPKSDSKVKAVVNEVHLFNIDLSEIKFLYMLKVEYCPNSFLFMNGESNLQSLLVGCQEGRLMTLAVKEMVETEGRINYELEAKKIEVIGSEAVQLLHVPVLKNSEKCFGIFAVCNHFWIKASVDEHFFQLKTEISPCICYVHETESIAMILEDQLRVFILEDLQPKAPFSLLGDYTLKKFVVDSLNGNIFIIESDNNSHTEDSKKIMEEELNMHKEAAKSGQRVKLPPLTKIPKSWASLITAINITGTTAKIILKVVCPQNEVALSLCHFQQDDNDLLFVGVAADYKSDSGCCAGASILTFKILQDEDEHFVLLHRMDLKSAPLAMCCYDGKVLIGIGRKLGLFCVNPDSLELELLCEKKDCVSTFITAIYPVDRRILVSDSKFGISYLLYAPNVNSLYLLQEDVEPIEVTAACMLKNNKMVRATKYGDIFIVELATLKDRDMSKVISEDEPPYTLSKEELLGCFHVGEIVTSLQIFNTFPNEPDSVMYSTLSGSIGILSQIPWEKDAKFLSSFYETLLGLSKEVDQHRITFPFFRDACRFRREHYKRVNVIDGNFLNEFLKLEERFQKSICSDMKEDADQITARLERLRRDNMLQFQF